MIPTRAMREDEGQYAVAFAIPVDAPGITLVARALNAGSDSAWEAPISSHDELAETFTVFNDVFVPYERVFLHGEWEYAGDVANVFASVNRQGYLGTESASCACSSAPRSGSPSSTASQRVGHIREKIAQLIRMERSIWALGVAASLESHSREPGFQIPDPVLTNAGKHVCMESHFTACRLLLEIAGGAVTTAPCSRTCRRPDIKPLVEKYFRGAEPGSAWERLRVFKLIRDLAASEYSGYWNTEIIHGSGSPAAEMLAMYRETDLDRLQGAGGARALQGRDAIATGRYGDGREPAMSFQDRSRHRRHVHRRRPRRRRRPLLAQQGADDARADLRGIARGARRSPPRERALTLAELLARHRRLRSTATTRVDERDHHGRRRHARRFLTTEGFRDTLVLREGGKLRPVRLPAPVPRAVRPAAADLRGPRADRLRGRRLVAARRRAVRARRSPSCARADVEAVAVSLLWSIANPAHEQRVGELLDEELPGVPFTLSHG